MEVDGEVQSRYTVAPTNRQNDDKQSFLPWVEKYRPAQLSDLVSQGNIVNTITKLIDNGRLPHLLFYGPPGTGKTTTILAIARKMYGASYNRMVLELNASDDRGIDVVREQIKEFAATKDLFSSGVKLIVLDEADAMTNDAQFALRRVIEKYTKNTRFCIICNYVSKIIPALQSRCTKFRFSPLATAQIESRLRFIADQEGIDGRLTDDGAAAILRLANGDMRKVLNVLQAVASGYEEISASTVYACTGNPDPAEIAYIQHSLLNNNFEEAYKKLIDLSERKGLALVDILTELSNTTALVKFPSKARLILLEKFSDIEYRLAFGTNDRLQAASLVGAFAAARDSMQA